MQFPVLQNKVFNSSLNGTDLKKNRSRAVVNVNLLIGVGSLVIPLNLACAENWVVTNAPSAPATSSAASTSLPEIVLQTGDERVMMRAHASATVGGRIIANYDVHPIPDSLNTNGMTAEEVYRIAVTNEMQLTAGYYRGEIYDYTNSKMPWRTIGTSGTDWVTIFSSGDQRRLAVARDAGPIYFSENSGTTWKLINVPGNYEFTLASTPRGSAMVALISVGFINTPAKLEAREPPITGWYSVGSAADGSKLVVTSHSVPALRIRPSARNILISWPASFQDFVLQRNSDLTTTNWMKVTNSVRVVGGENQLTILSPADNYFYRLELR